MENQAKEKAVVTETQTAGFNSVDNNISQVSEIVNTNLQNTIFKTHQAALNNPQALEHYHSRGLTNETIKRFKLGYSEHGFNDILPPEYSVSSKKAPYYKYILPFFNEFDKVVYTMTEIVDRNKIDDNYKKYYFPRGMKQYFFNEHYLKTPIDDDFIFICEGVYDAISIEQCGKKAIAILSTSNVKQFLNKIDKYKPIINFIIYMDNDKPKDDENKAPGQRATEELKKGLDERGYYGFIPEPKSRQAKDANEELCLNPEKFANDLDIYKELATCGKTDWQEEKLMHAKINANNVLEDDRIPYHFDNFFQDKKFLHNIFATYIREVEGVKRINNQLHIYRDGIYTPKFEEIEAAMIKHIPDLKRNQRAEVTSYLQLLCKDNEEPASANFIAFANGIYVLDVGQLIPYTDNVILTNKIPWDYNPKAYSELGDQFLNDISCNDKEIRSLLEEMIGYTFYRRCELRKAFILVGDKQNGKSTFLYALKRLLGNDNVCSLDLKELGQRFKPAELFGKLANIGDDISDEFNPDPSLFKKLTTGDSINVERKGKDPFDFENYAKLIFSANNIPRIRDQTGAVMSRLCIIPFNASFTRHLPDGSLNPDFDAHIKNKLEKKKVMEYFVKLGVDALRRVLEEQDFTHSQKADEALRAYEMRNNSVLGFIYDYEEEGNEFLDKTTNEVYYDYKQYCIDNGLKPVTKMGFCKHINRIKGLNVVVRKINGQSVRIFRNC